jgi:hypothetical protein
MLGAGGLPPRSRLHERWKRISGIAERADARRESSSPPCSASESVAVAFWRKRDTLPSLALIRAQLPARRRADHQDGPCNRAASKYLVGGVREDALGAQLGERHRPVGRIPMPAEPLGLEPDVAVIVTSETRNIGGLHLKRISCFKADFRFGADFLLVSVLRI